MVQKRMGDFLLIVVFMLLMQSCSERKTLQERICEIKRMGDTDPVLALAMLDSLAPDIRRQSEAVVNQYDLAKLRVQDKAYIVATSDIIARRLLAYYEKKGNDAEQQEAYYYAGSVYRDLQDTPHALECFLRSAEIAEGNYKTDSLMLRNTYSNLQCLFYDVLDYKNAYLYAMKEYRISQEIGKTELTCLRHVSMTYAALDSLEQAKKMREYTLDTIMANSQWQNNSEILISLLIEFSFYKDKERASNCFEMLERLNVSDDNNAKCIAYGEYYELIGKKDSAVMAYSRTLQNRTGLLNMYNAAKALFFLYYKEGDIAKTNEYAKQYILVSDSIDLGKRQELAATVNNEFQYHRNRREEERIISEKEVMRQLLHVAVGAIVLIILLFFSFVTYRKNRHLKELLLVSDKLNQQVKDKKKLQAEIHVKEEELACTKELLRQSELELNTLARQLDNVNQELEKTDEELKEKERLLSQKIAQNQTFINLLHQSELEGVAEDVIYAIRKSAEGRKHMTPADWKHLYKAVDELYPAFQSQLLKELGALTEQQMQVCYLMRIGLTKTQIQNMTNLSRVTIWRWVKKFGWIQTADPPK